ncbi:hypothetical protein AB0K15_13720 [Amycolatopsis sp. NPDC049253]|uniref:hypothetical protein n=1 Tax=Amycolatopsis sp. NPDC049253 TaxID=3155274 RepID=UPI003424C160
MIDWPAGPVTDIDAVARVLRDRYGKAGVVGLSDAELEEVRRDQNVAELPREWRRFMSLMGRRVGGLSFEDTELFYPQILGLKTEALDEFPSLRSRIAHADGLVVVGMHQEREFYVMGGPHAAGVEVVRYVKGEEAPSHGWSSFTELLQYELSLLLGVEAERGHATMQGRRSPEPERRPSAFARWRRKEQL